MIKNVSRILINSTTKKVWDAITLPEYVKQWQYGSDLLTTWMVGTEIRFITKWNEQIFEQWGKVIEFIPEKKIKYTLFAPREGLIDVPENYFTMIYELISKNDHIELIITQEDKRENADQEEEQGEANPILIQLKEIIAHIK